MEAATLNCPLCGAPARTNAPNCAHCNARLASIACPFCFGMLFMGSKFCPHCGKQTDRSVAEHTELPCPKCKKTNLTNVQLGETLVHECERCHGLWVEAATFDQLCTDREQQSAVLGMATHNSRPGEAKLDKVQYVPCPLCQSLMHRVNFAKCSGVIVDVCRGHGSWFDRDELQRIVHFIRAGGMETARRKEVEEIEESRRRLAAERATLARDQAMGRDYTWVNENDLISMAGSLISMLSRLR